MLMQIIVALIGALIGTYFGAFFLIKTGERKQKKLRNIAIRALKIVKGYEITALMIWRIMNLI